MEFFDYIIKTYEYLEDNGSEKLFTFLSKPNQLNIEDTGGEPKITFNLHNLLSTRNGDPTYRYFVDQSVIIQG